MTPSDADTPLTAEEEAKLRDALPFKTWVGPFTVARLLVTLAAARSSPAPAEVRHLVDEQAEDEGLWFIAQTAPEAYLQQELRRLHAVIEASPAPAEGLREALDRLVVAALPTLGTTNPDIRAAYKALNDSPPTGPCPRCGRPDAARSCPDCYSEFLAATATEIDRLSPPVDRDAPQEGT